MEQSIFLNTIKGKTCHRPPVWFMRQAGRVLPSYMKLREQYNFAELMANPKLAAEVTLLPVHELGVDAAILFSDILVIPEAMGMKLNWTDKGPRFDNPLKNFLDPLSQINQNPTKLNHIYKVIDEIIKTRPKNTPLIGFCGAPLTVMSYMMQGLGQNSNFPDLVKFLYTNKEKSIQIIDAITDLSIEYALNQIKHGIETFQLFETHAGLIPEDLYFELIMPSIQKIATAVRATGTPFIFLPKGLGAGLQRITPETTDYISVDWQTSMQAARKMVDPKIGLQGNIDPRLLYADQKIIAKTLKKYIEFGRTEKNWIINLGHGLLPDIPVENVKFAINWIKSANWNR